jgi:membrane associated rhomboid family serine protease
METYAYCNLLVIGVTCWFSWLGFRDAAFQERNIFWPEAILARRQYYRLVTSGFLHLDGPHLAMNMLSLYFFGPRIENVFGPAQFLGIYLGAIVGGNLLALYAHRHHDYRSLGASGGVAGVIFAHIFLFPGGGIGLFLLPIGIPSWLYAIGFLLASFHGMRRGVGNVGHDAHLGGALAGLFTAAALHPFAIRDNAWLFGGISAGTALLLVCMARNPLWLPWQGVDFTRGKTRPAGPPARFALRRILHFPGPKPRTAPVAPDLPDRRVDEILRKISESGAGSLTEEEKELLNEVSEKYRRRAAREKSKLDFPV